MKIAIVGASLAGYKTASALREFGSVDEILLVGEEGLAPYDRPPLSKAVLTEGLDFAEVSLESSGDVPDVDYLLGARAESLDLEANSVRLEGGERISYDALVVATGASARRLPWPDLGGVCYLRTFEDALELRKRLESSHRVVVVGGGFIGAEVAAAARHLGREVTVLEASVAPLSRVLGADVGSALGRLHDRHGVEIKCGAMVTGVEGEGGRVSGVHLATGEVVPADTVVVGIGAVPGTSWLESSGLLVDDGLVCDEYCRAEGTENVYAVGDVARWLNPFYGETMRVEHWTNAVEQAASVAQTILGDPQPYEHIPYVWSHQYEHKIQMVGKILPGHQPTFVGAADAGGPFVALYSDGALLTGAVALDLPRAIPRIKRIIAARGSLDDGLAFTDQLL